ncbi:MAG: DUF4339 domain-containing protein [Ginsengibacter sp.]
MIFYFLKEGSDEVGPLTLDQLKCRPVRTDTKVWFAGLEEWTTADEVHELKELFIAQKSRSTFSKSKLGKFLRRLFPQKKKQDTFRFIVKKDNKHLN